MSRPEIVVLGASLGGLDASIAVLKTLPADFPLAVVIVQHRMAAAEELLVSLLQGHTSLPVLEPADKDPIERGRVYVAPASYHLLVERDFFTVSIEAPVNYARPSIDVLFESAADAYGPGVVAVLLTNSNRDGAAGAARVKAAGGRVLVQDPATALSDVGPRAAIAATRVDGILALEEIGPRLVQYAGT